MPVITIYLNEELWEFVKSDKSRIIQQAVKELMDKKAALLTPPAPACPTQRN